MTVRLERKREHRRILIALVAALLIHLLILLVAVLVLSTFPRSMLTGPSPAPTPEPVQIVIIPPPEPVERPPTYIDSSQGEVTEEAPENAAFESDQNTKAASEAEAEGNDPVPTTDGEELPGVALRNQELTLGPSRQPAPPSPQVPPSPPAAQAQPREPKPEPEPTPTPQPTPKPEEAELAMIEPKRPPERRPEEEVRRPEPEPQPPTRPTTPGYQPQTRVTRLKGGISNRGRMSVEALATPLGRYKKMLSDAIGSRWYYYVNEVMDFVNIGTVELRFVVNADGTVESVKVLRNTSNESLASCSVRSIIDAEIPAIPPAVAETLQGSRLEIDYSFTIIGR